MDDILEFIANALADLFGETLVHKLKDKKTKRSIKHFLLFLLFAVLTVMFGTLALLGISCLKGNLFAGILVTALAVAVYVWLIVIISKNCANK